jgi:hypothetical protein
MKNYAIKGTPFYCFYAGRFVEGQLKWVIGSDNQDLLDLLISDIDQLWVSKEEATIMTKDWYNQYTTTKQYKY